MSVTKEEIDKYLKAYEDGHPLISDEYRSQKKNSQNIIVYKRGKLYDI